MTLPFDTTMESLYFTTLSFLVTLGILITVHEFGHFGVARLLGVKVLRFSIGFGPVVYKMTGQNSGTEYAVSAVPLGGYVLMLDEQEGPVADSDLPVAFNRQPLWSRSAIVAAGPLANLLFAVLAYWVVFIAGDLEWRPLVGQVREQSIAEQIGLQAGDEFVAVNGNAVVTWGDVITQLMAVEVENRAVNIRVNNQQGLQQDHWIADLVIYDIADHPNLLEEMGIVPARPVLPPRISYVELGSPAKLAGLVSGDLLLAADGKAISDWQTWVEYVRQHPNRSISLQIQRRNATMNLKLVPTAYQDGGIIVGRIGAAVEVPENLYQRYKVVVSYGPLEALWVSISKVVHLSQISIKVLARILIGQGRLDSISGPFSIAEFSGKAVSHGFNSFCKFLAAVSISLGVLNLLPIPILDGGHLLFFLLEGAIGQPLPEWYRMQAQRIGTAVLILLMAIAFYNDVNRLLG